MSNPNSKSKNRNTVKPSPPVPGVPPLRFLPDPGEIVPNGMPDADGYVKPHLPLQMRNLPPSGGKRYKKRTRKNCMHKKRTHKRKH